MAALQLSYITERMNQEAIGILIAPYLSPASRAICRELGAGYLDFEGNAQISFNGVAIDREVATKPAVEPRELKSLFKRKSARVLIVALKDPNRSWRVTELANEAKVSIGHISNIGKALLNHEFGRVGKDGFFLHDPDRLLDEWAAKYTPPEGTRCEYYTVLHGERMTRMLRELMIESHDRPELALASFSAANWLAPYARYSNTILYADKYGLARLKESLGLTRSLAGANVQVTLLKDRDILDESETLDCGLTCTSPVQTYLDLTSYGERGMEAAEYLRSSLLNWNDKIAHATNGI